MVRSVAIGICFAVVCLRASAAESTSPVSVAVHREITERALATPTNDPELLKNRNQKRAAAPSAPETTTVASAVLLPSVIVNGKKQPELESRVMNLQDAIIQEEKYATPTALDLTLNAAAFRLGPETAEARAKEANDRVELLQLELFAALNTGSPSDKEKARQLVAEIQRIKYARSGMPGVIR